MIVDLDERSLDVIGQWPWPRIVMAKLIDEIAQNNPSVIGLDIIFPEKDRTSPKEIQSFYKKYFNINSELTGIPLALEDNDIIFAEALHKSKSILSIYLSEKQISNNQCSSLESVNVDEKLFDLKSYPYLLCNTALLSKDFKNFGFINAKTDSDGITRGAVLFKKHKDEIVASLGLAVLLSLNSQQLSVDKNGLKLLGKKISADENARVLLHFYENSWYKKVSALDVLSQKVQPGDLVGKIVLIGSSAVALHDQVIIPGGANIAGTQLHATLIDNILHDDLLVQPLYYKDLNITISLLLTFLLFFLLLKKENNYILELFLTVLFIGVSLNLYELYFGIYLSIGYLLLPFLVHFFLISIIFIFIDTYERKIFSEELNRSHIALLDSMVHVAEVHDIETGAHIIRTKKYIKLLAEYIHSKGIYTKHISQNVIDMMYATAPMHDIGKVGIADSILKKEGKLTLLEYEVMKTHPDLGKHIINNAISSYHLNDFFLMARNIAYYHHEKWDGSGYPEGLKGEEIPLEARFMALADVYDALVSKRVYKEAFSYERSVKIIFEGRAKHFDPILVDAFMEIKDEFQKIADTYSDSSY